MLSRLKAVAVENSQEVGETKALAGAFFLGLKNNCEWLCLLLDGTVIKLIPPKDEDNSELFKSFLSGFYLSPEIKVDNINKFITNPTFYFNQGSVAYRNDFFVSDEVLKQMEEDIANTKIVSLNMQELIAGQKRDAARLVIKTLTSPSPNPNPTNPKA